MQFKWSMKELKEKSDNEIIHGILAEKMSELNSRSFLYKRLREIIWAENKQITDGQQDNTIQGDIIPRVIIRIEGGNFQGASANTFVDLSVLDIDNKNACDPVNNKNDLDYYQKLEQEVESLKPIH
jgi:hypothetical protein